MTPGYDIQHARQEASFRRAQRQYDAQEPPQDECRHRWKRVGERGDTTYWKCVKCGEESET